MASFLLRTQSDEILTIHAIWIGHRRRGRRKSERKVNVYGTEDLLQMFDCADVDTLLAKLHAISVRPHVTLGPGGSKQVFVSDYQLPSELR